MSDGEHDYAGPESESDDSESDDSSSGDEENFLGNLEGNFLENLGEDEIVYDHIEGYPKYEDIPMMTMTAVGYFENSISDINKLFYLLPISKIKLPKRNRPVKKINLPYPGQSNLIMTCCLGAKKRGIVRSITKDGWPHSIMIDISTSEKNVNCKISRTNVHMTGCKSVAMAEETTKLVIEHINEINKYIFYMNSLRDEEPDKLKKIIEDILAQCKGDFKIKDGKGWWKFDIFKLKSPSDESIEEKCVRRLCYSCLTDVRKFTDAKAKLRWLLTVEPFAEEPVRFSHVDVSMAKRRIELGFSIDLQELSDLFKKIDQEFFIDYFPDVRSYAKIEIPCKFQKENKKKKNEIHKHTFNIERTGRITMSTRVLDEMREIYYRFVYVVDQIRELIEIFPSPEAEKDNENV